MAKTGRPTMFTQEIANEICERIAEGDSLVDICGPERAPHLPHRQTVYVWLADQDDFHRAYRRAREIQADLYVDQMVKIADARDAGAGEKRSVARDKLRVDVRHKVSAKLAPKRYGSRVALPGDEDGEPTEASQANAAARIAAILEAVRRRHEDDEG